MRIWTWQATGARGERSRQVGRNLVTALLSAAVIFALPVAVTLHLKHLGERGMQADHDLQVVVTELWVQDGLEWRVISGRIPPRDVRGELDASRRRGERFLARATHGGLDSVAAEHVSESARGYAQAVDQELRLLSMGARQEAVEFDETHVDPAFEHAMTVLHDGSQQVSRQTARAKSFSDAGILLTVLLSLILISVVQSRRKRAEVRRGQTELLIERRYRALIDGSSDLVLVTDRTGRASFLSPSAERLFASHDSDLPTAQAPADAGAIDLLAAVDPQDRARLSTALRSAVPGRGLAVEVGFTGRHGTRTFDVSVQNLNADPSIGGLVLTAHDVTDRLAMQREMEHRALHDSLTGLANRTLLADRFDQTLRKGKRDGTRTGLLLLDLDRFKEINDTFGHYYGDEILRQVGPRLAGVLREVDTVARLGGDEFAVLLPDVHSVADAAAVAAKLRVALESPFLVEGVDLEVEASVGVVLSGEHGQDASTLLQRVDVAMYVAKTQNLGVFVYDPAVDGHSPAKLALLGELRRAIERGELVLHYQPKISISTGEVVGAEALVRWQHPERGLVFPDAFIPIAEHTGLIGPLTRHVLDAALAQARRWVDVGRPLSVAVNLSARNLLDDCLPDQVAELLAAHGVAPELLELEVTESAIMTEPVRAQQLLERLSALGIRIAIDDFGAGYTSLGLLKNLPVSELKIDRSFVMTMTQDPSNAMIVHSVVDLGHKLGMTIVAEGVESQHALNALADFGCDIAQGYHLSVPITADSFDTWSAGRGLALRTPAVAEPKGTQTPREPAFPPVLR